MPILRWIDQPSSVLDYVARFEKEYGDAQLTKAREVMDFAKERYLAAMAEVMPGKSLDDLGFSHHRERFGRFFLVRTRLLADPRLGFGGVHAVAWAVPPGPYLLQSGARAHNLGERMSGRSGKQVWRTLGPARPGLGMHPGMPGRPWIGPANETVAVFARQWMPSVLPLAIGKAQRRVAA